MSAGPRIKTSLKNLAKAALYTSGYYHARRRFGSPRENKLVILMYHNLSLADGGRKNETIDDDNPTSFQLEAHLRELTRRYRIVSVTEAVEEIQADGRLREDSVAITFDDGNESFYTVAWPLLVKYDAPATCFVVSSWVEQGRLSWWQHLCELIENADASRLAAAPIESVFGREAPVLPPLAKKETRSLRRFVLGLVPLLRLMSDDERAEKLARFQELLFPGGGFAPRESRVLTWAQIEEMAGNRVDFESHTRTHVNIPTTDLSVFEREIHESKVEIERHTGRRVAGFAYPYGKDLSSYVAVEGVLREHGFIYACNACPGSNTASSNPYSLYRYTLPLTGSAALINRELCLSFIRHEKHSC